MTIQKGPIGGTIEAGEIVNGAVTTAKILDANVTAGKLASGAAVSNIGYTPANKAGDTFSGYVEVGNTIRTTSISNPSSGAGMELAYDGTQGIIQAYSNRGSLTPVPVFLVTGQLKFPATQVASSNANTLDDYEEGSWTPVIDSSVAGTGRITTANGATYVKVGRQVTVKTYCTLTTFGSGGSGWVKISGLPFANSDDGAYAAVSVGFFVGLKANLVSMYGTIDPGGNWIEMRYLGSAGSGTPSLDWSLYAQANMGFIISATYIATA
jgi:hypothetical protein